MVTHEDALEGAFAALEGLLIAGRHEKHLWGCRYCQEVGMPRVVRQWRALNLVMRPEPTEQEYAGMERQVMAKVRDLDVRKPKGWGRS